MKHFFQGVPRVQLAWWAVFSIAVGAASAEAQTTFAWAAAKPFDVDHYTTVHHCLAFVTRIRDSVLAKASIAHDTISEFGVSRDDTLPTAVTAQAIQCSRKFPVETVTPADQLSAMHLYLMAGNDQDAQAVVQRRLAAIKDSSAYQHFMTIDTLMRVYLSATPVRLGAAQSLVTDALRIQTGVPLMSRLGMLLASMTINHRMGDSVHEKEYSRLFLQELGKATDNDKRNVSYPMAAWIGLSAMMETEREAMVDSLRRGTSAYVAWQQASWKLLSGEDPGRFPIGKRAPKLEGDFWFPAAAQTEGRPRTGVISLIVFLDNDSKTIGNDRWSRIQLYAILHRIAQRFPSVEITLVSQTAGYFDMAAPPAPEAEAKMMQSHWQGAFHLPGALSVTTTPFWRLQNPDTRRINQEVANIKNYKFGDAYSSLDGSAFLADRDGIIVYSDKLLKSNEKRWGEIMEVLVRRDGGTNAH